MPDSIVTDALSRALLRARHAETAHPPVHSDPLIASLFTPEELAAAAPTALQTAQAVSRAAFVESSLRTAALVGAKQFVRLGSGYDPFCCSQPEWAAGLEIFELDHPAILRDLRARLSRAGFLPFGNVHFVPVDFSARNWTDALAACPSFRKDKITFLSLEGFALSGSYTRLLGVVRKLANLVPKGSTLVLDYLRSETPAPRTFTMDSIETLLDLFGFLTYEHPAPDEITQRFFSAYNAANPASPLQADSRIGFCLAVRE